MGDVGGILMTQPDGVLGACSYDGYASSDRGVAMNVVFFLMYFSIWSRSACLVFSQPLWIVTSSGDRLSDSYIASPTFSNGVALDYFYGSRRTNLGYSGSLWITLPGGGPSSYYGAYDSYGVAVHVSMGGLLVEECPSGFHLSPVHYYA